MEVECASSRAEITLTSIRRECDCVSQMTSRQVVADGAVHIMLEREVVDWCAGWEMYSNHMLSNIQINRDIVFTNI